MHEQSTFDRLYQEWEKHTSAYLEKVLRNPGVLDMGGAMLNAVLRGKIAFDQMLLGTWKTLLLPNKRDQERTLHLLNEVHGRLYDIEERLERLSHKAETPQPAGRTAAPRRRKSGA